MRLKLLGLVCLVSLLGCLAGVGALEASLQSVCVRFSFAWHDGFTFTQALYWKRGHIPEVREKRLPAWPWPYAPVRFITLDTCPAVY